MDLSTLTAGVNPAVVDINTQLGDPNGEGAGTGIVLSPSGEVLTNNHVINAATSIIATDVGNGQTYPVTVVGYDRSAGGFGASAAGIGVAGAGVGRIAGLWVTAAAVGTAGLEGAGSRRRGHQGVVGVQQHRDHGEDATGDREPDAAGRDGPVLG